jgi:hypothetical protein
MIKIKNIVYGFILLLLAQIESKSFGGVNLNLDQSTHFLNSKDGNIVSPPNVNQESENYIYNIYVPTPLEPEVFEKMKKQQLNNEGLLNTQIFSDQPPLNLVPQDKNSLLSKTLEMKEGLNLTESEVNQIIKLQENDYQKYFDQINNLEYQKVYKSLNNPIQYEESNQDILDLDYNNILYNLTKSGNINPNNYTVNSEAIINLPLDKKEIENVYSNVFNGINLNNSFSFVQTNKDIELIHGKAPIYGQVDSKPKKFSPDLIGMTLSSNYHEKDYEKKVDISEEKAKELQDLEMEKRERSNYPRFRSLRPHEVKDIQEKKEKDTVKEEEFNQMKKRLESSFSFIQQDRDNLAKAIDYLINKKKKKEEEITKKNLENCNENCNKICSRAEEIKGEGKEICSLKCQLACSNNALNNLFS